METKHSIVIKRTSGWFYWVDFINIVDLVEELQLQLGEILLHFDTNALKELFRFTAAWSQNM